MRRALFFVVVLGLAGAAVWYYRFGGSRAGTASASPAAPGPGGAPGGGMPGGGTGGGRGRTPMTVDTARAARHEVVDSITVVGNLIAEQTVDVVPRVAGRIEIVHVKLGDRVQRGQVLAKIEDRELREQIRQAEASLEVNKSTVTARENDLKVQENIFERFKQLAANGLTPKQQLEDAELRHNSARSQVDVAKSQQQATQARLDELKITLGNTTVLSPLEGFVSRRLLDPGGFAGANTVIMTVVDIGTVRLVANLVEKGFNKITAGVSADVEVDTFPGEQFKGQVSRVAPVFDPATRTAAMEIEVPNPGFRLKPGSYARVRLTVERRADALTVPRNAVVDTEGKRGVFMVDAQTARFREVQTGLADGDRVEVLNGLNEGDRIVTVGALALRDGDRIVLAEAAGKGGGEKGRGGRGGGKGGGESPNAGKQ
jgi:RND family efflux transporter MFP subunit